MKAVCILNPAAGRGTAGKRWKLAQEDLARQGVEVETVATRGAGDAAREAAEAIASGFQTIIVAGGDGTIGEVAGAAAGTEARVALAPFGTGNDLAAGLGIPLAGVECIKDFDRFVAKRIDLGVMNGRRFANMAGLGFDARVASKINTGLGRLKGTPAYLLAIAACLWDLNTAEVEIRVEDGEPIRKRVLMVSFANNKNTGGGLKVAPGAVLDDGCLDLFILEEISRLEFLKSFRLLLAGTHGKHRAVSFYRGKRFSLNCKTAQYIHVDGEVATASHLEVYVEPGRLNLLVPPGRE